MNIRPEYFGKYILLEKIAAGGMAEVFLAKTLGAEAVAKLVAIKRILPQFSKSEEFIAMFKEEAKIAINLAHPNIVTIIEFGIESQQFYIAMEYVEGRNLRQILNRMKELNRSFSPEQGVYLINETARGLDHAHRCIDGQTGRPLSIIHRDISPQNLMLSFEANVKVVDFGIAKAESQAEATKAGTLKGKFSYMSPEQAEGIEIDSRTDIFSLGIVLWELLANDRLFLANNEMNTLRKIKECHIPSLHKLDSNISPELERIVNKALARDKNLRYQSASDLQKELNSYLNHNHPDFSNQDLSIFMKQLFAEELLEGRRKLIEYGKISFNRAPTEKTIYLDVDVGSTNTKTEASLNNISLQPAPKSNEIPIVTEGTDTRNRRLDTLQPINGKLKEHSISRFPPHTPTRTPRPGPMDRPLNRSNTNTSPGIYQPQPRASITNSILIFAIIGAASYLFFNNPQTIKEALCKVSIDFCVPTRETMAPMPVMRDPDKSELPSIGNARVTIASQPSGAQIYAEGILKGKTPSELEFPLQQTTTLTLRREGFLDKTQSIRPSKSGQTYNFDLQKMKTAYISIHVMPGSADVYINDVKLLQSPPITMYAVPANTQLKIRASSQFTGTSAEQTLMIRENSHQSINLFLKKTMRRPTGQRN